MPLRGQASGSTLSDQILRGGCSLDPRRLRLAPKAPHSLRPGLQALRTSHNSAKVLQSHIRSGWDDPIIY